MSPQIEAPLVLFLAFILDLCIGDPEYRFHPIRIIGKGVVSCLCLVKRIGLTGRGGGAILVLIMVVSSVALYSLIHLMLLRIHHLVSLSFDLFLCYSCLALKDLINHIRPVIKSLESGDIHSARKAIAMVVGRDVNALDTAGVTRAAIETMAENLVDGFISPVLWYAAGALTGMFAGIEPVFMGISFMITFKTASTLDSMVGYKDEEFVKIGWAGARLDDIMNLVPARLSLIILFFGACLTGLKPVNGMKVAMRDRLKHESPNSAHAESLVAGALNVRLGGPTRYHEGIKDKPWLGHEYPDPYLGHIKMTIRLLIYSSWVAIVIACMTLLLNNVQFYV